MSFVNDLISALRGLTMGSDAKTRDNTGPRERAAYPKSKVEELLLRLGLGGAGGNRPDRFGSLFPEKYGDKKTLGRQNNVQGIGMQEGGPVDLYGQYEIRIIRELFPRETADKLIDAAYNNDQKDSRGRSLAGFIPNETLESVFGKGVRYIHLFAIIPKACIKSKMKTNVNLDLVKSLAQKVFEGRVKMAEKYGGMDKCDEKHLEMIKAFQKLSEAPPGTKLGNSETRSAHHRSHSSQHSARPPHRPRHHSRPSQHLHPSQHPLFGGMFSGYSGGSPSGFGAGGFSSGFSSGYSAGSSSGGGTAYRGRGRPRMSDYNVPGDPSSGINYG